MQREAVLFVALVVAAVVVVSCVSAVSGALFYAGWYEPDPRYGSECECC